MRVEEPLQQFIGLMGLYGGKHTLIKQENFCKGSSILQALIKEDIP